MKTYIVYLGSIEDYVEIRASHHTTDSNNNVIFFADLGKTASFNLNNIKGFKEVNPVEKKGFEMADVSLEVETHLFGKWPEVVIVQHPDTNEKLSYYLAESLYKTDIQIQKGE